MPTMEIGLPYLFPNTALSLLVTQVNYLSVDCLDCIIPCHGGGPNKTILLHMKYRSMNNASAELWWKHTRNLIIVPLTSVLMHKVPQKINMLRNRNMGTDPKTLDARQPWIHAVEDAPIW